ncbi:histidine phosphatase family protein [Paenibacillus provencensis]|uniref:Histidine phosphatase family protein n=1 Tax=Paenibacillus provencensis TaxID=441151 RepID=A0ABW3Q0A5_9BACL|nr:histidine phosphatase family protein [Paenibacillus sp. MER 78]
MTDLTTIYIVRHGQTEWNVLGKMQGHQDSPLTELGTRQARWLGEALAEEPIDVIYSSSSGRAVHTAEVIRGSREIPVTLTDNLREMNLGLWEGRTGDELKLEEPMKYQQFWEEPELFAADGGETYIETMDRAQQELKHILKVNQGKTVLIVTHTVVVKLLMTWLEQRSLETLWDLPYIHPASLCKIVFNEENKPKVVLYADISHYPETAGMNGI